MLREYPSGYGRQFAASMKSLIKEKGSPRYPSPVPDLDFLKPADLPPTTAIQDLWHDAKMVEVLQYLYGNQNLSLPDDFKSLFPPELWAWA
ncbi:unnamed protein product [Cladocopium goreaui]|uniref:Uncharacterized protein n=1 Tax=Cladocopium goreaui TaxID=2562237 RepID=A0A9P1FEF8_9DINO|nr:unnamed protein product [Cladocopium goreaui]